MSRKQSSTALRIRKKAASPAPPSCNNQDPFHNGQTPSCRLLLHAIQDVFPELQQQMKEENKSPSSNLGILLRREFLKKRKARRLPLAPFLASPTPSQEETTKSTASAASKKKRKRKKKKKQDTASTTDGDISLADDSQSHAQGGFDYPVNGNGLDDHSVDRHEEKMQQAATAHAPPSLSSLAGDSPTNGGADHSVHALGQSVYHHEENVQQETAAPPALGSLPSDENRIPSPSQLQSSVTFFEQIQPQPSEDSSDLSIPPPQPDTEDPQSPKATSPKTATATLAATKFVTPTKPPNPSPDPSSTPVLTSPTHEWVPEEGGTMQPETPPGDVIKDPLELPYLLTLSSDNGLTTTTIDGSLISAERSVHNEQQPSSLETTKVLLEEWLDQLLDEDNQVPDDRRNNDCASFVAFLQATMLRAASSQQQQQQPLGIPLDELRESCAWIECSSCRREALNEVDKLAERPEEKPVILNPNCLKEDPAPDVSVEAAFDYVALEEGHLLPPTNGKQDEDEEEGGLDLKTHLSFVVSGPKQKKSTVTKHLYFESLTQKHLDTLVDEWLPCGIEEDIMVTTTVTNEDDGSKILDSDEFRVMQQKVLAGENDIRGSLDELHTLGQELQQEMSNVSSSFDGSQPNLEFKAFPIMKKCDKTCAFYMDKLLKVLRSTTSERSIALAELQLQLWTAYLGALGKTLKACDAYYNKVAEEMADQRGVVPKMFVSAALRSLFQTLVEEKVRIWTELGTVFSNHLTSRLVKEWYTRTVWESQRSPQPSEETLSLDERCHDLIREVSDWTVTLLGGRVAELQKQRMDQTEHLLEQLQTIVEPLAKEYETVEKYFSTDRNRFFASLRSNILLAQGVRKQMRLVDNNEIECMSTGVILMWRHVRIMQSRMITSVETPPLPLQLKRWMLQDERQFDEWRLGTPSSTTPSYHEMYCQPGRGGKRRVMCVLAGLVYRWLEDRCTEWKAEIAEKELLADFDIAEPVSAANTSVPANGASTNKPNKSSKKKKKKNKAAKENEAATSTEAVDDPRANGTLESIPERERTEIQEEAQVDDSGEPSESYSSAEAERKEAVRKSTPNGHDKSVISQTEPEPDPIESEGEMVTEVEEFDVDDYLSAVYVEDEEELLSAKNFLVARMAVLLQNAENGKIATIQ
jgi:hypothetical protein